MVRFCSPGPSQPDPKAPIPLQPAPWLPGPTTPRTQREFSSFSPMADSFFLRLVNNVTCLFQCPSYLFQDELFPQAPFSRLFWTYANLKTRVVWLAVQQPLTATRHCVEVDKVRGWRDPASPGNLAEAFTAVQDTGDQYYLQGYQ